MPAPAFPPEYVARPHGMFPLRGGPLCGLRTDQCPHGFDIPLHYIDPMKRHWETKYRFNPDDLLYDFVEMERVGWG